MCAVSTDPVPGTAPLRDGPDVTATISTASWPAVVDRADPTEPVVLVGHSFGSYPGLRYAAAHRDRVHSVVLLDGVDPALGLLAALDARSWSDVRMAREGLDLAALQQQTETALSGEHPLGNVPLVVVRRGEQATGQWSAAQERLADLSTSGRLESPRAAGTRSRSTPRPWWWQPSGRRPARRGDRDASPGWSP